MEETAHHKGMSIGTAAGIVILLATVLGVSAYLYTSQPAAEEKETPATRTETSQDAASGKKDEATTPQSATATTTTDTATADWKTYRNEKLGYQLRYPSDWTATAGGASDPAYPFDMELDKGDDHLSITSGTYGTLTDGSVFDRTSALRSVTADGNYKKIAIAGGGEGYYIVEETLGGPAPMVQLIGDRGTVTMQYSIFDSAKAPAAETLFKQMIGTFKFLP